MELMPELPDHRLDLDRAHHALQPLHPDRPLRDIIVKPQNYKTKSWWYWNPGRLPRSPCCSILYKSLGIFPPPDPQSQFLQISISLSSILYVCQSPTFLLYLPGERGTIATPRIDLSWQFVPKGLFPWTVLSRRTFSPSVSVWGIKLYPGSLDLLRLLEDNDVALYGNQGFPSVQC